LRIEGVDLAKSTYIDPTAEVSDTAQIGEGVRIWGQTKVCQQAKVGDFTSLGRSVYLGPGCTVGTNCKIQNLTQIYEPCLIGDGVFLGPGVIITNDKNPRSLTIDFKPKEEKDWVKQHTVIGDFVSLGAGVICVAPVVIGRFALIGAGAVVTHDVPEYALMLGAPARRMGWVGPAGTRLEYLEDNFYKCSATGKLFRERSSNSLIEFTEELS
jgi:UDP-2-acetamido-3-amino-2,3-dideoxy-glucuronate N-acetyltransferase